MAKKFILLVLCGMLLLSSNTRKPFSEAGKVTFYVDPVTNSDDPDIRMAYGLNIVPPWPNGGSIFVNLPEHLEYMPGTKGIARHHDNRKNVWQVNFDSTLFGRKHYRARGVLLGKSYKHWPARYIDLHPCTFEREYQRISDQMITTSFPANEY